MLCTAVQLGFHNYDETSCLRHDNVIAYERAIFDSNLVCFSHCQETFAIQVVDGVLEDIRLGMEVGFVHRLRHFTYLLMVLLSRGKISPNILIPSCVLFTH